MKKMVIKRLLTTAACCQVAVLERDLQPDGWTEEVLTQFLATADTTGFGMLVACEGERVIGYLIYQSLDVAELLRLGVDRVYQGRGVGQSLVCAWLSFVHTPTAMLEVRADNAPAIALYEKMGFDRIHIRRGYYKDAHGTCDAWIMQKVLADT